VRGERIPQALRMVALAASPLIAWGVVYAVRPAVPHIVRAVAHIVRELAPPPPPPPEEIVVPDDYPTLDEGLNALQPGQSLLIEEGEWSLEASHQVPDGARVHGRGMDLTRIVVSADVTDYALWGRNNVTFEDFEIVGAGTDHLVNLISMRLVPHYNGVCRRVRARSAFRAFISMSGAHHDLYEDCIGEDIGQSVFQALRSWEEAELGATVTLRRCTARRGQIGFWVRNSCWVLVEECLAEFNDRNMVIESHIEPAPPGGPRFNVIRNCDLYDAVRWGMRFTISTRAQEAGLPPPSENEFAYNYLCDNPLGDIDGNYADWSTMNDIHDNVFCVRRSSAR